MNEFSNFILEGGLLQIPFSGSTFTWWNKHEYGYCQCSRLGRPLVDHNWTEMAPHTSLLHLNSVESDHAPLLVEVNHPENQINMPFKFLDFWCSHAAFQEVAVVASVSTRDVNPLIRTAKRAWLQATRRALAGRSKDTFRDIFQAVQEAEDVVLLAEINFARDCSPSNREILNRLTAVLKQHMKTEEDYLASQSQTEIGCGGGRQEYKVFPWLHEGPEKAPETSSNPRRERKAADRPR